MPAFLGRHGCCQEVVGLIARALRVGEAARDHELRQQVKLINQFHVELTTGLIGREEALPEIRRTQSIPSAEHRPWFLSFKQA
jgi:hypothetical protein